MGAPRARRSGRRGATLTVSTVPTKLARQQIASLRGKPRASFLLAVEDIRRGGCAAAGVRLAGEALSGICRFDLYGLWRLLAQHPIAGTMRYSLLPPIDRQSPDPPQKFSAQATNMTLGTQGGGSPSLRC
jgi:hypothetical protein